MIAAVPHGQRVKPFKTATHRVWRSRAALGGFYGRSLVGRGSASALCRLPSVQNRRNLPRHFLAALVRCLVELCLFSVSMARPGFVQFLQALADDVRDRVGDRALGDQSATEWNLPSQFARDGARLAKAPG